MDPLASSPLAHRYEIRARLHGGVLADTYLATDRTTGAEVVVKRVPPDDDAGPARRFLSEREALRRVTHPGVVRLVADDTLPDHTGLLVLARVPGTTLRAHLRQDQRPAIEWSVDVVARALDALAAVHAAGLVHRDVKPENLLVDGRRVTLIDFGLACPSGPEAAALGGAQSGTPTYMSPEQIRGEPLDGRADVYGAGVVLYELLAGVPPFVGVRGLDVRDRHLTARCPPPSVVAFDEAVEAFDPLVLRALEKAPADRFADAAEFAAALRAALG